MRHAYFTGKKSFFNFGLFRWLRAPSLYNKPGAFLGALFSKWAKLKFPNAKNIDFFKILFLVAPMSVGAENSATGSPRRADSIFDGLDAQRGPERP